LARGWRAEREAERGPASRKPRRAKGLGIGDSRLQRRCGGFVWRRRFAPRRARGRRGARDEGRGARGGGRSDCRLQTPNCRSQRSEMSAKGVKSLKGAARWTSGCRWRSWQPRWVRLARALRETVGPLVCWSVGRKQLKTQDRPLPAGWLRLAHMLSSIGGLEPFYEMVKPHRGPPLISIGR
jgi:hypothetical protein